MSLLRARGASEEVVLKWLEQVRFIDKFEAVSLSHHLLQALSLNLEATKERPNELAVTSSPTLINLCGLCLRLCRPFLNDPAKLDKIDWEYVLSEESSSVLPKDSTRLVQLPPEQRDNLPGSAVKAAKVNFITQSFFICWRALHLGVWGLFPLSLMAVTPCHHAFFGRRGVRVSHI